jgi:sucrose-6-phosphate hydrolase SacC (GH32 family)
MHGHRPYFQCHYYLGRYEGHRFLPEEHGRMNWPGGQLSAPETLLDDRGRRIMFGWIHEAQSEPGVPLWTHSGWASVMSLPRVLSLGSGGHLCIEPAEELARLRTNHRCVRDLVVEPDGDTGGTGAGVARDASPVVASGDCLEIAVRLEPGEATQVGLAVRCSPDGEEATPIVIDLQRKILRVELGRASLSSRVQYPRYGRRDAESLPPEKRTVDAQEAPLRLDCSGPVELRVFVDRSVLEVFVNREQCVTQRIYPTRADSLGVVLVARGGRARAAKIDVWDMHPTVPW